MSWVDVLIIIVSVWVGQIIGYVLPVTPRMVWDWLRRA